MGFTSDWEEVRGIIRESETVQRVNSSTCGNTAGHTEDRVEEGATWETCIYNLTGSPTDGDAPFFFTIVENNSSEPG